MSGMSERTYTTVDKSGWGPGPWQDEPDKIQWVDEATGLDCLIVRNPLGALCGYVGVPPEHPWHGRGYATTDSGNDGWDESGGGYDTRPDARTDVHGGLTYSDACQEGGDERVGICHVPLPGRPAAVWWFGFDCAHSGDVMPAMYMRLRDAGRLFHEPYAAYRTVGYVRRECARLAAQLAVVASDAP